MASTHKEQFTAMLDEAGIDYGPSGGDTVVVYGRASFLFGIRGEPRGVRAEAGDYDDIDY